MARDPDAAADDRAAHERDRLVSLRKFDVFDTGPERAFDDLATLAAQVCAAPMAMVCFVGDDRQAFKARVGTSLEGTGRDISFCAHAIEQRDVFVIPDASADPRFATNPLVTDDPGIRFYAGAPVVTDDGHALGTVCVADRVARDLTAGQREALRALARQAMNQLELRLARHEDVPAQRRAEVLLRAITEGTATATGSAFFSSLVRQLASALQVRRVFVAECLEDDRARSRAVWLDNEPQPNFEYSLVNTPCMKVTRGETCLYSRDVRRYFPGNMVLTRLNAESYLGVPLWGSTREVVGHMVLVDDKPMSEDPLWISVLQTFAARAGVELEREQAEERLRAALGEVETLKNRLEAENVYLQEEIRTDHNFDEIVGRSPALMALLQKVERVADTDSTVLIFGETGSGKELIARGLHSRSPRRQRALVKVNCGAVPSSLIESELFGHVKGAFTGALDKRVGRFELADGGTIFLDEIGEVPAETQVKLLRVLQEREFEPVGSSKTIRVDVRIIAATNRDLAAEVRAGRFRSDLFFRLNVVPLTVPPLRQRPEDIPLLVAYFVARFAKKFGRRLDGVSRSTMDRLVAYPWQGNIRELQNIIERAVVLSNGATLTIDPEMLAGGDEPRVEPAAPAMPQPPQAEAAPPSFVSLEEAERRHIAKVLQQTRGVIEGPAGAAKILNLNPNTLRSRMKKLGVTRSDREIS
jgi:transcriptional regulator with GAF, ATPase, and Fis domain